MRRLQYLAVVFITIATGKKSCSKNSGLTLLAKRPRLKSQPFFLETEMNTCAGPSRGWRIRATTSSCGWCWDVNELEFHTDQGRLGLVDYHWGDWIRACEPVSSGNYDNGRFVPGRAFDGDHDSRWAGRKKTADFFYLGLTCNSSYVVNKVVLLSPRQMAEEIRIERLVGDVWTHVQLVYPQTHELEAIYECVPGSTTTSTTVILNASPFSPVGTEGASNRACRGDNSSDNSLSYYLVRSANALEDCQAHCFAHPRCHGIEYRPGRCEIWTRPVTATAQVNGFQCHRYVEMETRGFLPVDGGVGRACRGAAMADNNPAHYQVTSASSLKECQDSCLAEAACKGVEYSRSRCELWTRAAGIGASFPVNGFRCMHLMRDFAAIDGGQDRACRGDSSADNLPEYYMAVAASSLQDCGSKCSEKTECQGIEFSRGRCELWVQKSIGATAAVPGFICLRKVSTSTTTTGAAFSFFKFVPLTLRHNGIADSVALSELTLYQNGTDGLKPLSMAQVIASNPNGESLPDEGPEKAIDGLRETKWLDMNKSDLVLQFPQPVEVAAFSFSTANDNSQRDPEKWALMASKDGNTWSNLHLQLTEFATPKIRLSQTPFFAAKPGQWAIRIRAQETNTGWMWLLFGLEATTPTGALIEPNAACTPFDSASAFDGNPWKPWFADKSGTWRKGQLRGEDDFWFGLQCNCVQDLHALRFLQKCSGHFTDEVWTEEFRDGAWRLLSHNIVDCEDGWVTLYNASGPPKSPPDEPCKAPIPPAPAPPGTNPANPVAPTCTESSSPSEGCMGVTVSEHVMPRKFAQTTGFTVRPSNFCNNKFCNTPQRMSMESCGADRLILAWTAHTGWDGSTQHTVGHISEFRYDAQAGSVAFISDQELTDCAEMGRLSVTPDCGVVTTLCRSERTAKQVGAFDFLQATEDKHGEQFGWNEDDADSLYLFEWADGSEGQTAQPPAAKVRINHAIGGWKYGHWEAVLDKSLSTYMVQLKTKKGGHEGAVNFAINRKDWTWNPQLSQGWACGTGHVLGNRLTYNPSLDRWARFCWTDWHRNGNGSARDAIFWGTMPQTGERNVAQLYTYPRPPSYWEHAGGPTNLINRGSGWLGVAVAPDPTEGLRVTPGLVKVPSEVSQCEEGTADCTFKWMDAERLPGTNDYLTGGKLAYANLQQGGDGSRLFVGWAGEVGGQRAWGGYYVVEVDEDAQMYGKVLALNTTGWGEDNAWTALPRSGCIAMPFTWDQNPPGHDYGNQGVDDDLFSDRLRITVLCPPAERGPKIG